MIRWEEISVRRLLGVIVIVGFGVDATSAWTAETTSRPSVSHEAHQANSSSGGLGVGISAGGRFVSFGSTATNLVPGDTNGFSDAFVRDRGGPNTTKRVSVGLGGAQANGGLANDGEVLISANGHVAAFGSTASNLVPGDTNGLADLFTHDQVTGRTARITVSSSGAQATGGGKSRVLGLSADGRFVVFESNATNLVPNDTNKFSDVFVRDRKMLLTERVNVSSTGVQANRESHTLGGISSDGRFVAFSSTATSLVLGGGGDGDAFVRDRLLGKTELVSGGLAAASNPSISGNGRFVAFRARKGGVFNIFVHDRTTKTTTLASSGVGGAAANGDSDAPAISQNGDYVAYVSEATNLVAGDSNHTRDIFVLDRDSGETTRASVSTGGAQGNGPSFAPAIAPAGYYFAFVSNATNLVANDTNGATDVFARKGEDEDEE
jgi:hypothetical protein